MNEINVCPLCGTKASNGKCPSCGYIIPDNIELDYMTALYNGYPEDYPRGEELIGEPPQKIKIEYMPDVNAPMSTPVVPKNITAPEPPQELPEQNDKPEEQFSMPYFALGAFLIVISLFLPPIWSVIAGLALVSKGNAQLKLIGAALFVIRCLTGTFI